MSALPNFFQLVILLFALSSINSVHAHAVITQSTLSVAPIRPEKPTNIALQFNSKIEIGLSQVFLVSTGDKLSPLKITQGGKPGEVFIAIPPLTSGEYALKLKVFAADGHLTEDILHFIVTP